MTKTSGLTERDYLDLGMQRANIANDDNFAAFLSCAKHVDDGFIVFALRLLDNANLLNQDNFNAVISYPKRVVFIAKLLIRLDNATLSNENNRNAVVVCAEYALDVEVALKHLPTNLLTQDNFDVVVSSPKHAAHIVPMIIRLNEANLLNESNRQAIIACAEYANEINWALDLLGSLLNQDTFNAVLTHPRHALHIQDALSWLININRLNIRDTCNAITNLLSALPPYDTKQLYGLFFEKIIPNIDSQLDLDTLIMRTLYENIYYVLTQGAMFYRTPDSSAFHGLQIDPYICMLILEAVISDVLGRTLTENDTKEIYSNIPRTIEYMRSTQYFKKSASLFFAQSDSHMLESLNRTVMIDTLIACKNANGGDPTAQHLLDMQWGLTVAPSNSF